MHVEFAVEHRERGGVHMHVLAARCDLETGRSLNIAPPGWRKTLGRLRDGFNHEHGRSRPDGPASPATAPTSTRRTCRPVWRSSPTRAS